MVASYLYSPGTDRTENIFSIIACSLVAGEKAFPQRCSLATVIVLLPVYTAVTWQWVYLSHYVGPPSKLWAPHINRLIG
jgi:hypothetical protein